MARLARRFGAVLIGALLSVSAFGQDIPELSGRVVDEAELLDPAERTRLESLLAQIEAETTVQIVILSVPRIETSIEDFSIRVAEAWGIGQAETDNGALVVVSVEDRASRIEVGYGLESVLPDGLAGRILREGLRPHFQEGNYATGFEQTALRIAGTAIGTYSAADSPGPAGGRQRRGPGGLFLILALVGFQILGFLGNAIGPWAAGLAGGGVALLLGLLIAGPFALLWLVPLGLGAGFMATGMTRAASARSGAGWGYAGIPGGGGFMMGGSGIGGGFGSVFSGGGGGFGGGGASGSW